MPQITIATLNIAAGSKERVRKLLDDWIAPTPYDVYVITETSDGPGTALLISEFRNAGWTIFQRPGTAGDRGVAIVSQIPGVLSTQLPGIDPAPGRCLVLQLNTIPRLELIGMYIPNRGNDWSKTDRKRNFLAFWKRYLCSRPSSDVQRILLGDLNVVPLEQHPTFLPQEKFEYDWFRDLTRVAGLYDAALSHGAGHESTWESHGGEGYTYDHILLQTGLSDRVLAFRYDHSTRKARALTDHSALILSLEVDTIERLSIRRIGEPIQMQLF
jgi:exodeoxyribonuclease-3